MLPFNIRFLVTAGVTGIYSWGAFFVMKLVEATSLPAWTLNLSLLVLLPGFLVAPVLAWRWIARQQYMPSVSDSVSADRPAN